MAAVDAPLSDKYELLERLGEGGMGTVYKVRHRLLDELRVVKAMRSSLRGDDGLASRFLHEARVATRLRHPHIAQIFDFTVDEGGNAFIIMEFIEGCTLERALRHMGVLPTPLVLELTSQILRALAYLHTKQFVHRDISPDNMMICRDEEGRLCVKLIDLGIAKILGAEQQMTATGLFLGKVRYASPEQLEGSGIGEVDGRSDLYSLGVVVYELLTGHFPIQGSNASSWIAGHLYRPPKSFEESDPEGRVPPPLRRLLLELLAKNPGDRPDSARELLRRLAELQESFPLDEASEQQFLVRLQTLTPAADPRAEDRERSGPARETTPAPWRQDTRRLPKAALGASGEATSVLKQIEARVHEQQRQEILSATADRVAAEARAGRLTEAERLLDEAVAAYGESDLWSAPLAAIGQGRVKQREQQAASLLADAAAHLDAGDLDLAADLARQALDLHPDSADGRGLAAEIDGAIEKRAHEQARDRAAEGIDQHLEAGHLEEASRLLERHHEAFGADSPFPSLRRRLEDLRLEEEIGGLVTQARSLLRSGDLEPAVLKLEEAHRRRPSHGEVEPLLQKARAELVRRADTAKIEHAAKSAVTEVRPAEPTVQKALDELPLAARGGGAPPQPTSEALRRIRRWFALPSSRRRLAACLGIVLVLLATGAGWWIGRSGDTDARRLSSPASATFVVDAVPWGEVVEVLDQNGRPRREGLGESTPVALTLPPGHYRVRLRHPDFGSPVELEAELVADGSERRVGRFSEVSVDELLASLGL